MGMATLRSRLYRLLRWSERYTKTDMVYLATGGFWSALGQFVASLLSFLLAIGVAHLLSKDAYGEYKYILAAVSILGMFSLTGLGSAVFQSVARGFDGALQEGFLVNLRWSIVMVLGALGLSTYYFLLHNNTLAIGVLVGGCFSPFLASANLSNNFLAGKKDFRRQSIYFDVIENLIPVGSLFATILLTQNPAIIAAVYFISNTFTTLYIYWRVIRTYAPNPAKKDPGMFSYGGHLSVMGILGTIANNIDQIALFHFVGPVELAVYNFATALPDQIKGPAKMLDSMLQARFAAHDDQAIRNDMRNKMFWLAVSSLIFVVAYIVLAPAVFHIFFPKYLDAVPYSQIYMLSWLVLGLSPAASFLSIRKKVKELYYSTLIGNTVQIGAIVIGTMYWGLPGLIGARITARIFGSSLNYMLYRYSAKT
jgi:O-antigen/teichoic acid export membrane protein